MPVATAMVDAMLGTFRTMAAEIDGKGLQGPAVDELRAALARMEQLAQTHSDIAAYSGQLAQENLMMAFGEAYGRALSGAARAAARDEIRQPGGEAKQLARTLEAYEQALAHHRGTHGSEPVVRALEEILALGRSGITYLAFCRQLEERGLDRVLDGVAPLTRAGLVEELALVGQQWDRWRIAGAERELAWLDAEIARVGSAVVDPLAVTMAAYEIRHAIEPHARAWALAVNRWERAIENLVDWLDAHTSFARHDDRWAGATPAATEHNLARTRACNPGQLAIRLELLARSGIAWDRLTEHETFRWEYTARRIGYSDERLRLAFATRPHSVVGGQPPRELVAAAEALHAGRRTVRPDVGRAPPPGTPLATFPWS